MALLTEIIQQQNFELVRDKIGAILAEELAGQAVLNFSEKALTGVVVHVDRSVTFDHTELPAVNVFLDGGTYDNETIEKQDGSYSYNIDIYTASKTSQNVSGDKNSLRNLQRLCGIIRAILQSPHYLTLGFSRPSVSVRSVKSIQIQDPRLNQDALNTMYGRIILDVRFIEMAEQFKPVVSGGSDTEVRLEEGDKGFFYVVDNP